MQMMVALKIDEALGSVLKYVAARRMPKDAEYVPINEMHVTIAATKTDVVAPITYLSETISKIANEIAPLSGEISGIGIFYLPNGQACLHYTIDIDNLNKIAAEIERRLRALNVNLASHPFRPHITIAYFQSTSAEQVVPLAKRIPISFDSIYVVKGDYWIPFKLRGFHQ